MVPASNAAQSQQDETARRAGSQDETASSAGLVIQNLVSMHGLQSIVPCWLLIYGWRHHRRWCICSLFYC